MIKISVGKKDPCPCEAKLLTTISTKFKVNKMDFRLRCLPRFTKMSWTIEYSTIWRCNWTSWLLMRKAWFKSKTLKKCSSCTLRRRERLILFTKRCYPTWQFGILVTKCSTTKERWHIQTNWLKQIKWFRFKSFLISSMALTSRLLKFIKYCTRTSQTVWLILWPLTQKATSPIRIQAANCGKTNQ